MWPFWQLNLRHFSPWLLLMRPSAINKPFSQWAISTPFMATVLSGAYFGVSIGIGKPSAILLLSRCKPDNSLESNELLSLLILSLFLPIRLLSEKVWKDPLLFLSFGPFEWSEWDLFWAPNLRYFCFRLSFAFSFLDCFVLPPLNASESSLVPDEFSLNSGSQGKDFFNESSESKSKSAEFSPDAKE